MICDNIAAVKWKIRLAAQRCNRNPDDIKLICVTKGRSLEEIEEAVKCGVADIGENRVQETLVKYNQLAGERVHGLTGKLIRWHLIGHLQTNKARDAVAMFDLIHSVDSLRLAVEIDKQAARINKAQDILVEVNTSGEASKYGLRPEDLIKVVSDIIVLQNIRVRGLMTMAPAAREKEKARPYFRKLRELRDKLNLADLSMGMSQDYEVAIEEGATLVRIGTAIFAK